MFGFFKKFILNRSADIAANEIKRFNTSLSGMDGRTISGIVIFAHNYRKILLEQNNIDLNELSIEVSRDTYLSLKILNEIKEFQKYSMEAQATGLMVWVHSLRSVSFPENRILGRQMWGHLKRDMDDKDLIDAGIDYEMMTGNKVDLDGTNIIPHELNPEFK